MLTCNDTHTHINGHYNLNLNLKNIKNALQIIRFSLLLPEFMWRKLFERNSGIKTEVWSIINDQPFTSHVM